MNPRKSLLFKRPFVIIATMSDTLDALIEEISQRDNRYKEDAYTFILEAL